MRLLFCFMMLVFLGSCASEKPKFVKEKVCSREALKYLNNPRNKHKRSHSSPSLMTEIANTSKSMQLCYEDFKNRTGYEEFNTCLVVGVDHWGNTEFLNFSSREIKLDQAFLDCARSVTGSVPYSKYGTNYILIQSYQFYVSSFE
ncbi:MAG: hypothetical protein NDI69_13640 [Bacteriovoracaceae bacterium]|nr:hypothetical protein [Bacteriovoracaceae bacterium]